jgi:tetraacyldisaccharide 4'-kinase
LEPVVLTRGYGRISHRDHLVLARGAQAAVWHTGDEPQILLRSGVTGLGIGPDRYIVGEEAERILEPDVFLGDDAFSHRRLARDVDLVLIDSLDPFGSFETLPLGRLREPMEALARADVFVITRAEAWRPFAAIERHLRRFNHRAPIFRSWLTTQAWVSAQTGFEEKPPERVVAFCGLGNPHSFWRSVERQGLKPLDRLSYGDHHAYAPRELRALAAYAETVGAKAMLTTEKDLVNFPEGWEEIFAEIEVLWLRVEVGIENEAELLELLNPAGIRARRESDRPLAPARR